jgi:DNA-binding NtrC family response regulator
MKPRILVVDDEAPQLEILRLILGSEGYEVVTAASGRAALAALGRQPVDVALTDLKMPDLSGIALLEAIQREQPGACVVLMTAHGTIDSAVEAMRKGAFDYLTKPLDRDVLLLAVQRALERTRLVDENRRLREELRGRFRVENLIGAHGSMQEVFRIVHKVARSTATVLVYGESGTGKELVARAIHFLSPRAYRLLVPINCSAIPAELLESELFGHVKGAFTGAHATRAGKFEAAHNGTIFLDEIGEMSPHLQVKLLRVLQEKSVTPVGGNKPIPVDVRVIAATNKDLEEEVAEGRFRSDLYFRLDVIPLRIPPLRERRDDIPVLAAHFIERYDREKGRSLEGIRKDALEMLQRYPWPGNVRELENLIERVVVLKGHGWIEASDLPEKIRRSEKFLKGAIPILGDSGLDIRTATSDFETALIRQALHLAGGNRNRAATLLGLKRTTLVEMLKRKQIDDREPHSPAS